MQNRIFTFSSALVLTTPTDILNCAITSLAGPVGFLALQPITQPYINLMRVRVINKHATLTAAYSLFIGASGGSAAGTEFMQAPRTIALNDFVEWTGRKRMNSGQFLSGFATVAAALTIEGDFELGFS